METMVSTTVHFMDGSKITFHHPRQFEGDSSTVTSAIRKALDMEKLVVEVDGTVLVIPMGNVKYFQVTPAPKSLPVGVIRATVVV